MGNFKVDSPRVKGLEDIVVLDLWILGHKEWDVEMIHELFGPRDASAILNIPLSYASQKDRVIWYFSPNGVYSVKSGYRVARDLNTTNSQAVISCGWDKLWKLPIPPKAGISINVSNHTSFANCLLEFLAETDWDKSGRACMVLWSIWSQRNSKLWRNNFKLPDHDVTGSLQLLHDWKQAQIQKRLGMVINLNHQGDGNWRAPPPGSFKCNVDATSFTSSNLTGFGIVIRDELGAFVKGYTSTVPGLFVLKEGEVMALIAAIKWGTDMDIQNVVFETDALVVWKALRAPASDLSEFGSLVHECSSLL
nr:TPA_asm: hypothetical protein HUJ06_020785 [Nelumbo nucifera]